MTVYRKEGLLDVVQTTFHEIFEATVRLLLLEMWIVPICEYAYLDARRPLHAGRILYRPSDGVVAASRTGVVGTWV